MIRFYKDSDYESVNNLLSFFNNDINLSINPFCYMKKMEY